MASMNTSGRAPVIDTPTPVPRDWKISPVKCWALTGACRVVFMAYVLGAWVMSDTFVPTDPGPDPFPELTSYLRNNMCGEGTPYQCPGPRIPFPRAH